jgi:protein-tyrosine sulfotransferase
MLRWGLCCLRSEMCLWKAAWSLRAWLPSGAVLLVACAYLVGPIDLIPSRIPYVGHLDEAAILIAGLIVARLLLPPDVLVAAADELAAGAQVSDGPTAHLITWLVIRRRMVRLKDHAGPYLRRLAGRLVQAAHQRNVGDILFASLGYRPWWWVRSIGARRRSEATGLIVLGGSPRSGTTLLRTILGRHSMIASGAETTVFLKRITSPQHLAERLGWDPLEIEGWQRQSRSQMEFIEHFQQAAISLSQKPIWLEKTPRNIERFQFVRRHFPHAKLVHIIRDGRDVVCSLRRTSFARIDHVPGDSVKAAVRCATQWRRFVESGMRLRGDAGYYELRYEDLVLAPEQTIRSLLEFLGLPWEDEILIAEQTDTAVGDEAVASGEVFESSRGRWRRDLPAKDKQALGLLIGPTLIKTGYEAGLAWSATGTKAAGEIGPQPLGA